MIQYHYSPKENIIYSYPEGVLTAEIALEHFASLEDDPDIKPGATEQVSFQNLKDIQFSHASTLVLRAKYEQVINKQKIARLEFIVDNDLAYGMARMVQTGCECYEYGWAF